MLENIPIEAQEIVPGRPFTDPVHSQNDLRRMRMMAQQLLDRYDDPQSCNFFPGKNVVSPSDPAGRHFQIYYIQPELLFSLNNLTVVGFFGIKRPGADIEPLVRANNRMEDDFHNHPGLLSLSTVELPSKNFANLVIFSDPRAKQDWNRSTLHRDLVAEVSPPYYQSVRLNNAILPRGLAAPKKMRLTRIKYIDYTSEPHWRGVRSLV
jgi:hypothetical protein